VSVLELPRLHFRGTARIHAPTGDRNAAPIYDLATQAVYRDGVRVDPDERPAAMHQHLRTLGPRFGLDGAADDDGPLSAAAGWNFGGNGHFSWTATISGVQHQLGRVSTDDPVVGRAIDLWGHHNPYLGTTFNRARIVRHDPSSPWSTQVLAGRVTLGRGDRSLDQPYALTGDVAGPAPARLQRFDFITGLEHHWLAPEFGEAALYQLVLPRAGLDIRTRRGVLGAFAAALDEPEFDGLVVQFAVCNLWAGAAPEGPGFADLVGTVGLWRASELQSFPAGRLLVPAHAGGGERSCGPRLGAAVVRLSDTHASFNIPSTVPRRGRAGQPEGPGLTASLGPALDVGPLELRLASGPRLAVIPYACYARALAHGGIVDVPVEHDAPASEHAGLRLFAPERSAEPLLVEREWVLHTDDAAVTLEHPSPGAPARVEVEVRSFWRGRPAAAQAIHVESFYNPRAVPGWRHEAPEPQRYRYPLSREVEIAAMPTSVDTDDQGRGTLELSARRSGTARVLLLPSPAEVPAALRGTGPDAIDRYVDIEDRLGLWGTAGSFSVRVLPDDRRLEAIPAEQVDYPLLYREVLQPYELLYSFMADEVFSLADRCKVETYARLMWQMSDPANLDKTYFMPPTRDLSRPKLRLLRAYLRNVERRGPLPTPIADRRRTPVIAERDGLVAALRLAVELEQLIMLSYLFAAYSIPNYETARTWVAHGHWTEAQLRLACGDGHEGLEQGFRGALLEIAHEEMIHFLVVNNLLRAIGEPFYAPVPEFELARRLGPGFPIELAPMSTRTLANLLHLELPHGESPPNPAGYGSIAELYRSIRAAFVAAPERIVVAPRRSGGEHHLFLSEAYDRDHPDYQLEVDDLASACFALDFITGQGEGAPSDSRLRDASHHQRLHEIAAAVELEAVARARAGRPSWALAYPVLPNPSRHLDRPGRNYVPDPEARAVMGLVDDCYALSLRLMALHFCACPSASLRRSKLMNASIDVMTGTLRPLCLTLVGMPSGVPGWNAGPGFELAECRPPSADLEHELLAASAQCQRLAELARQIAQVPTSVRELLELFTITLVTLAQER
jgi:chromopyrrolic acid synthase